jgi:hypothetical protein
LDKNVVHTDQKRIRISEAFPYGCARKVFLINVKNSFCLIVAKPFGVLTRGKAFFFYWEIAQMTGEEGTEGKANDQKPAEFAKKFMFLLTFLPRLSFKTAIRRTGARIFLDKPKQK